MTRHQKRARRSGLGILPPETQSYWKRYLQVVWGWGSDRINSADGAYIRPQVEQTLSNDARLFLQSKGTAGWFAGRPDEYALYVSEYGGEPANFQVAQGTPVYQPTDAAAIAAQYHLAEQGRATAFNQGPLNVLPTNTQPVSSSPFSLGPVTPSQAAAIAPVAIPTAAGLPSSLAPYYPATAGFPEVGPLPDNAGGAASSGGSSDIMKIALAALGALALFN